MRHVATMMMLAPLVLASCGGGGSAKVNEPDSGAGSDYSTIAPWEIVYLRSLTIDVGGCVNAEHMDKAVHIAPQGINIYVTQYTQGEIDPALATRKLISTIPPDEEPAKTIIATVYQKGYYTFDDHATFALPGAEPSDGCSDEHETVTITTPSTTGIITLDNDPGLGLPTGVALEIYELVTEDT